MAMEEKKLLSMLKSISKEYLSAKKPSKRVNIRMRFKRPSWI
jgi:hypothetical protein